MSRLPQIGGDDGQWGALLNDFLLVSHDSQGNILPASVANKVNTSTVTAKGDILTATAANTVTSLHIGSDGQVLTADSSQSTGMQWTNPTNVAHFAASAATTGITPTDRAYKTRTLTAAYARVATAPAGSDLVINVQHWNGSTWSTVSTLTISDGSITEATTSFTQAQVAGNLLRLNISSVGSSVPASGVAVDVLWV